MTDSNACIWFKNLSQQLRERRQRSLIVLHGDTLWAKGILTSFIQQLHQDAPCNKSLRSVTWGEGIVDDEYSDVIVNFRQHLGRENDLVLFNDSEFHPDAFAALSGTIVAGGMLIWLCSPTSLLNKENLFIQRLWAKVKNDKYSYILSQESNDSLKVCEYEQIQANEQNQEQSADLKQSNSPQKAFSSVDGGSKTYEQQCAVEAIEKVALGHRKRPLVLTADRGRGKSSALAIAVANRLLSKINNAPQTIVITAPHIDALAIFFQQLQQSCPDGTCCRNVFTFNQHRVEFIALDVLIKEKPAAQLLLVDEAAAIPVYILSQLVDDYHRVVFSSTQHGYEGAGRGFAVKFKQVLANKTPQFNQYHIHQPIRWADEDPLENFIFDAFLLYSFSCSIASSADAFLQNPFLKGNQECVDSDKVIIKCIEQQHLFTDEKLLQQVFSVLVTAHYQTSPSDLKLLLNNQAVRLFVAVVDKQIIAVALTLREGNAQSQDIHDIAQAKRRLKDQFLPQSLFLHNHCSEAFDYQYLRIMRIAVLPSFQHQGLGLKLLAEIKQYAIQHNIDMLGTSFGANEPLLYFWHKAAYHITRLGFSVDKASGEHSAMYLQPLTSSASKVVDGLQKQLYRSFIVLLTEQYQHVSVSVITQIIMQWPQEYLPELTRFDRQVVDDFITRKGLFNACVYSLHIQLIHHIAGDEFTISQQGVCNAKMTELLVKRLLQKHNSESICQSFELTGKKQVNNALIDGFTQMLSKS